MSQLTVIGYLGKDAETKVFESGARVTKFSVAESEVKKLEDGKYETTHTEWTDVVCWNHLSDRFKHLKKGNKVVAIGRKRTRTSENEEGKKMYFTELNARTLEQCVVPERTGSFPTANDEPFKKGPNHVSATISDADIEQDDLPF